MDIYREVILDHYKHPKNFGHLHAPDVKIEDGNVTCGDRIVMEIKVNKKKQIKDICFSGEGCAISQASASMLTEKIRGKTLEEAAKLTQKDILTMIGTTLTQSRTKCAMLSLQVLNKAIISLKK